MTHHDRAGARRTAPVVFNWKAPPVLSGSVTFQALVLTNLNTYFNISGLQIAESIFLDGFE